MLTPDMNLLEELLGLKKFDLPYRCDADLRFVNGFCICREGESYWSIKGKFPMKIAEKLNEKSERYGIRINGNYNNNFKKYISHERLEEEFRHYSKNCNILDMSEFVTKCNEIEKDVLEHDYDNCYTKLYHIDTYKGLKYVVELIKSKNIITQWFL